MKLGISRSVIVVWYAHMTTFGHLSFVSKYVFGLDGKQKLSTDAVHNTALYSQYRIFFFYNDQSDCSILHWVFTSQSDFDWELYKHNWQFPLHENIILKLTCTILYTSGASTVITSVTYNYGCHKHWGTTHCFRTTRGPWNFVSLCDHFAKGWPDYVCWALRRVISQI